MKKKSSKEQCLFGAILMTLLMPVWFVLMRIVILSGEHLRNGAVLPGLIVCGVINAVCVVFQWTRWKNA